jgi:hypothetical protein
MFICNYVYKTYVFYTITDIVNAFILESKEIICFFLLFIIDYKFLICSQYLEILLNKINANFSFTIQF